MEKFKKLYEFIGNIQSFKQENNEITFETSKRFIKIIILSEKIIRIRTIETLESSNDYSWSIIKKDWPKIQYSFIEQENFFEISTQELKLHVSKNPFCLSIKNNEGKVIWEDETPAGIAWREQEIIYFKKMPINEHYFGFGEKTGVLDKRGYHYKMNNRESPLYQPKTDPLYQSHPYFIGIKENIAYGIFFDNTNETFFDMGKKIKNTCMIGAERGELNLYFFYGPSMKEVIKQYTDLIGRIMLPPVWSLGFIQCRWGYKDAKKITKIASKLREYKIPCDSIVYDLDYMIGKRVFTWNEKKFPDPVNYHKNLNEKGLKIITIIDPGVKVDTKGYYMHDEGLENDYFLKRKDGSTWHGYVWPGKTYFPDFTKEDAREWWGNKIKFLLEKGISGIWNDMNEISYNIQPYLHRVKTQDVMFYDNGLNTSYDKNHNVYGLLMARATHEGLLKHQPNKRPWILTRAGFPGVHRYSAVWTGDNSSSWQHLAMSIPMLCNMGLSAIPNVGADIGGFGFNFNCLRKLIFKLEKKFATRWHQLGAFYPFSRNHCVIFSRAQEPWQFGEEALEIIKKYIKLRYRWMPYFYNLFVKCSKNGLPPMRPLILEYQDDEICYGIDYQFLWGESILFAPVVKKNLTEHEIYLPEGTWFNYWTGEKHEGKKYIKEEVNWNYMPIFIKAASIIPCQPDMEYFKENEINPLILELYPEEFKGSEYEFYEDDGESLDYLKGKFSTTKFILSSKDGIIQFVIEQRKGDYNLPSRKILMIFRFINKPKKVTINDDIFNDWTFENETNDLKVQINDNGTKQDVRIFL